MEINFFKPWAVKFLCNAAMLQCYRSRTFQDIGVKVEWNENTFPNCDFILV